MRRTGVEHSRLFACAGLAVLVAATAPSIATAADDATNAALDRCLASPANASTAGQVACESIAMKAYDRRMNAAYAILLRKLPASAAQRLRAAQRAWIGYRDSEALARGALYATREGTMFVPMQADAAVAPVRDRALLLERYVRVMAVGP